MRMPRADDQRSPRDRVETSRRRGAAAVEFAFIAPILLLLILGIMEVGRMMMVQQIVTNAAREGCRKAVLAGATETQVQTTIDNYLSGSGISGHTRTISPTLSSAQAGDAITVTVSVPYDNVTWLPIGAVQWMKGKKLQASVVMRKEAS